MFIEKDAAGNMFGGLAANCCQQQAGLNAPSNREEHQAQQLKRVMNRLDYHSPTPEQMLRYQAIRDAAKAFATVVVRNCPLFSDDTNHAIAIIEAAVMQANKAIALEGK